MAEENTTKKDEKKTIEIFATAPTLNDLNSTLEKKIKSTKETLSIKGKEISRKYTVKLYKGENPNAKGIFGEGDNYKEALKNAEKNPFIKEMSDFNELIECRITYELTTKEEENMKTKSKGTPAGPGFRDAKTYFM